MCGREKTRIVESTLARLPFIAATIAQPTPDPKTHGAVIKITLPAIIAITNTSDGFGSYARGDFGRKSDLDLLVLIRTRSEAERTEAERRVIRTVIEAESDARIPVHLAPLVADAGRPDALGSSLLHELWTDGVILYGEASALATLQPSGLALWDVVRFSLQGTLPRERVRLARRLHGTAGRPGIIRLPGINLARGAALVPADQARAVRDALDDAGATYDIVPVWREV